MSLRLRPWSAGAFLLGLSVLVASTSLQALFVAFGATPYFATFFPAVFAAGFLAGTPAAVFVALFAVPLVWWVFMPPSFEFNPLTLAHIDAINLFFLLSVLLIFLADVCRQTVAVLRIRGSGTNTGPSRN
jgi:K+-sensing histidine kinase KdpD